MIRLLLLGPPDLRLTDGSEAPAALRAPKTVAFLARLAFGSPDFVRRDQLVGLLWPELDDARARNALSKALHHARKALGDEVFVIRGNEEIGLSPSHWSIDLWEVEAALAHGEIDVAIGRYGRGALLEGVHLADAPNYEPWLDGVRERLQSRLLKSVLARADVLEATPEPGGALPYLARAADLAPADEVIVRRRLRLLDRVGDRGGARRVFEQFVTRLRRDLELEPSPETIALLASIVDRRQLSAPPAKVSRPAAPARASHDHPSVDAAGESAGESMEGDGAPLRVRRPWKPIVAVAAATVLASAVVLATRPAPTLPTGVGRRVLVAPFANRTGDTALRILGEMVADFVAQGIQRADILEVVDPLTSVLAVAGLGAQASAERDAERTLSGARRAGAGTVVSGAFYRRGDSLVFQAEVIDVERRRRLAVVDSVVTGVADAVAIATRVREATAGMLATIFDQRLASIGAGKAPAPSLAGYREFRRGLELFPTNEAGALPYFLAASRLDSTFAQPLIWASFVYGNSGRIAERDSVVAHLSRRREQLRGLDRHAVDYFVSRQAGRIPEALDAIRAAAAESPGSHWSHNASNLLLAQNRVEAALAYSRQVDPEHGWAGPWIPYWKNLTNALHLLGRHEEELREIRRAVQLRQAPGLVGYEVRALIALGRVDEGERRLDELARTSQAGTYLVDVVQVTGEEFRAHGHLAAAARALARATETASRVTSLANRAPGAVAGWAGVERAWSLYESERVELATRTLDSLRPAALDPRDATSADYLRALIAAARQRDTTALRALDIVDPSPQGRRDPYQHAQLAAAAGDQEGAVRILRELLDGSLLFDVVMWLHRDHEWGALSDHPPFRALMKPR